MRKKVDERGSRLLLFASNCLGLALAGARICVRALATDRKTLTVAQATVAGKVHKTLDVHRCGAAKVALYGVARINGFADLQNFGIRKILHTAAMINSQFIRNLERFCATDTVNIGKRNDHALIRWYVNPGNTSQFTYSCSTGAPKDEPYLNADDIPKRTKPADAIKRCWRHQMIGIDAALL
jgi:hypothetical protein